MRYLHVGNTKPELEGFDSPTLSCRMRILTCVCVYSCVL